MSSAYYNPETNVGPRFNVDNMKFDISCCTHRDDAPEYSLPWFDGVPAKSGYEWKRSKSGPWPEEVPIEPSSEKKRRIAACTTIDTAAGAARTRFATNSAFIESEYLRAYETSVEWINLNYQGEAPAPVRSDAEAFGRTDQEAAKQIKATGDHWFGKLDTIRDIRLKGKQAVEQAADDADFMAVAQPFIDQLEALKP